MAPGVDVPGAAAPGTARDQGTRAREQLGAFFLLLSAGLAVGLALAARDPHRVFAMHSQWWWAGWSLGMCFPALVFWIIPWSLRAGLSVEPRGAVEDAVRGFYAFLGGALILALVDAAVVFAVQLFRLQGAPGTALGYAVAPVALAVLLARPGGMRPAIAAAVFPAMLYQNALMLEWVAGAIGVSPLR